MLRASVSDFRGHSHVTSGLLEIDPERPATAAMSASAILNKVSVPMMMPTVIGSVSVSPAVVRSMIVSSAGVVVAVGNMNAGMSNVIVIVVSSVMVVVSAVVNAAAIALSLGFGSPHHDQRRDDQRQKSESCHNKLQGNSISNLRT